MTSEQQTLPGPICGSVDTNNEFSAFQATLLDASKGVTEGTDAEYKRLMQQCQRFLVGMGWLRGDESFYSNQPHRDAPTFIIAWIMNAYPPSLLFIITASKLMKMMLTLAGAIQLH